MRKTIVIDQSNLKALHRIQGELQNKSDASISFSLVCNIAFKEYLKRR